MRFNPFRMYLDAQRVIEFHEFDLNEFKINEFDEISILSVHSHTDSLTHKLTVYDSIHFSD